MATINPYLSFGGNCEAAFEFYKSVFGGEFTYVGRYGEMPGDQPAPESCKNMIMHISLPISKETSIFGADSIDEFCGGQKLAVGNNITICVNPATEEEAKKIFTSLSAGGNVLMALEKTFWGALFGMFTDKFGINWMVNYEYKQEGK